ncbi:MAG TPA: glycine cleavage system protein GcvH [Oleiagrimonas sp.]|nr:glycine cleavage system protein GcvH [Oleiagrimonas sp.]
MSDIPGDLKFLKTHEWARLEENGLVRVGISDHAQELLGDIVYVELPEIGAHVDAENGAAVVESVKAASDIYPPVSGEVVEVNETLGDQPELINEDAFGEGWIFVVKPDDKSALDELLDPDAYAELLEEEEH